jgi:hypothetical protein
MAALTVENTGIGSNSLTPTFVSANIGGDTFVNDGRVLLYVKNGDASPMVVTITTPLSLRGGIAVDDPETTVPATDEEVLGPFDPTIFNAPDGSGVAVEYSADTSVTVAVIRLQKLF